MGLLLLEGIAQNHQACSAFTEQTQTGRKGTRIQRRNRRLIRLNAGPVDLGMI
jgi:hypothetical protein